MSTWSVDMTEAGRVSWRVKMTEVYVDKVIRRNGPRSWFEIKCPHCETIQPIDAAISEPYLMRSCLRCGIYLMVHLRDDQRQ